MTNKKLAAMALAVPLFALFVVSTFAPALAATKLMDVSVKDVPFSLEFNGCSASDDWVVTVDSRTVLWDSDGDGVPSPGDKFDFYVSAHGTVVDSFTGDILGRVSSVVRSNDNPGGLPITSQLNAVVTCKGSGPVLNNHIGLTIDENGNPHLHNVI